MNPQVLCIEDDQDIALAVRMVLSRAGFEVVGAADGGDGLRVFHNKRPDLVLLDLGLPTLDGWTVLERIRDMSDVPVMLLTAHGHEVDKVRGLSLGADDYLTKPFGNAELVARVQALLRRTRAPRPDADIYHDGLVELNFATRDIRVGGEQVALTPNEFRLLAVLVRHVGQTLSAEQLLEQAWNDPLRVGPERVKFAVMRLRRKLTLGDGQATPIEAVRGFGYRYVAPHVRRQLTDRRQPQDRRRSPDRRQAPAAPYHPPDDGEPDRRVLPAAGDRPPDDGEPGLRVLPAAGE